MSDSLIAAVAQFIETSKTRLETLRNAKRREELTALLNQLDELADSPELSADSEWLLSHTAYRNSIADELAKLGPAPEFSHESRSIAEIAEQTESPVQPAIEPVTEAVPEQILAESEPEPEPEPLSTQPPEPEPPAPKVLTAREINKRKRQIELLEREIKAAQEIAHKLLRRNLESPELRFTAQQVAANLNRLRAQALDLDQPEIANRVLQSILSLREWKDTLDFDLSFVYGFSKEHAHAAEDWKILRGFYQCLLTAQSVRKLLESESLKDASVTAAKEVLARLRAGFCDLNTHCGFAFKEPDLDQLCGTESLAKRPWPKDKAGYIRELQHFTSEIEKLCGRLERELRDTSLITDLTQELEQTDDPKQAIERALQAGLSPKHAQLLSLAKPFAEHLQATRTKEGRTLVTALNAEPKKKAAPVPPKTDQPLAAQEPVQRHLRGKSVFIMGGLPDEEKRQALELALGTTVTWPEIKEETGPERVIELVGKHDVVLRFTRFSRHNTKIVKDFVKRNQKEFIDVTGGQGVNNIVQSIFDQTGLGSASTLRKGSLYLN